MALGTGGDGEVSKATTLRLWEYPADQATQRPECPSLGADRLQRGIRKTRRIDGSKAPVEIRPGSMLPVEVEAEAVLCWQSVVTFYEAVDLLDYLEPSCVMNDLAWKEKRPTSRVEEPLWELARSRPGDSEERGSGLLKSRSDRHHLSIFTARPIYARTHRSCTSLPGCRAGGFSELLQRVCHICRVRHHSLPVPKHRAVCQRAQYRQVVRHQCGFGEDVACRTLLVWR